MDPPQVSRLAVGAAISLLLMGQPAPQARAQNESVAPLDKAIIEALERYVEHEIGRFGIPGMAVGIVQDGKTVFARGFGDATVGLEEMTSDSVFLVASLSKMITATALMVLVEEGLADLHTAVTTYLPELAPHGDQVTLDALMHHRSGLSGADGASPFVGDLGASLEANVSRLGPLLRPGWRFEYSNANYDALALVVERVSGMPFDRFVAQRVFAPIGMDSSWIGTEGAAAPRLATGYYRWLALGYQPHQPWMPPGMSGSYLTFSTVEDLSRLMIVHLNEGAIGGAAVLSPSSISTLHEPYRYGTDVFPIGYAGGLAVFPGGGFVDEPDRLTDDVTHLVHDGSSPSYRSFLTMSPDTGIGVVVLANANDSSNEGIVPQIAQNISYLVYGEETREVTVSGVLLERWGKQLVLGVLILQLALAALSIGALKGLRSGEHVGWSSRTTLGGAMVCDVFVLLGLLLIIPRVAGAPLRVVSSLPDFRIMFAVVAAGLVWGAVRTVLTLVWSSRTPGHSAVL